MLCIFYLIFINIVVFLLMCEDKKRAIKRQFRISEKTLLILASLGGVFGMICAMKIIHHKNRKFKEVIPNLVVKNIILIILIFVFL